MHSIVRPSRTVLSAAATLFFCLAVPPSGHTAIVAVTSESPWQGFMNVFETPANGGAYVFGSDWAVPDLPASFSGSTLTLGVTSVNDTNAFWYTPSGGPGAEGNKYTEANMYVQSSGFAGQSLTFSGYVLSNTLTEPYTAVAFIKDFAPNFSSSVTVAVPLTPGAFSVTLETINDPARHVQYGFAVLGPVTWITDAPAKGTVVVAPIPEYSAGALLGGVAMMGLLMRRVRRRSGAP